MSYWVSMDDAFPIASLPSPTIHQLPPPPIEFAEPKSAAVKLAGGGLVRMEEGKGTRWHETPPACQVVYRAAYSRARIPVAGETEAPVRLRARLII